MSAAPRPSRGAPGPAWLNEAQRAALERERRKIRVRRWIVRHEIYIGLLAVALAWLIIALLGGLL